MIPNYGERRRYKKEISAPTVESTVNAVVNKRFCKKQQMQWSKEGAHLLLHELDKDTEAETNGNPPAMVSGANLRGRWGKKTIYLRLPKSGCAP